MRADRLILAALLAALPLPALACDKYVTIPPQQVTADYGTLTDQGAPEISRLLAFTNLQCSDQAAIRAAAINEAWKTGLENIQSQALWQMISSRPLLVVQLQRVEGLTDAHYTRLDESPTLTLGLVKPFPDRNCISLYRDSECSPAYSVTVNGSQVDVSLSNVGTGTFRIDGDALKGQFTLRTQNQPVLTFPATITLF